MTLIKTGGGITDIRGPEGGVYFTRDRSGLHCLPKPRRVHQRTAAQDKQRKCFSAARSVSTDPRIVSYLIYRGLNDLPIRPHWDVTGDPVPDCKGRYILGGTYGGKDYYKRLDSAWFIYWFAVGNVYLIHPTLSEIPVNAWFKVSPITGEYAPQGTYTGNPVFTETTYEPPPDYQIPKL